MNDTPELEERIRTAISAEREACAKECDVELQSPETTSESRQDIEAIAQRIRARVTP